MDTDGIIFQVETEDIYKNMSERSDIFNLNGSNIVNLMKDECPGYIITEAFLN